MVKIIRKGPVFFFAARLRRDSPILEAIYDQAYQDFRYYYDISDLVYALQIGGSPTGIQRVQVGLTLNLLRYENVGFVFVDRKHAYPWLLSTDKLRSLLRDLSLPSPRVVREAFSLSDRATITKLRRSDTLINIGSFWPAHYTELFYERVQQAGVRFMVLIYDLIPLILPETCDTRTVRDYVYTLPFVLCNAAAIITISDFTKRNIEALLHPNLAKKLKLKTMPLAHGLDDLGRSAEFADVDLGANSKNNSYVLCVGTIEPRKNHRALTDAWKRLSKEIDNLPTLIVVGKIGWKSENIVDEFSKLEKAGLPFRYLSSVSDGLLSWLYKNCRFTVFPSLLEGWGLPVGESLSFGKVCVTSALDAMAEAGGNFAIYFDANAPSDLYTTLRSIMLDPTIIDDKERAIRKDFRPRSWREVAKNLHDFVTST